MKKILALAFAAMMSLGAYGTDRPTGTRQDRCHHWQQKWSQRQLQVVKS